MKIKEVKQLDTKELVEKIQNAETALDKMRRMKTELRQRELNK